MSVLIKGMKKPYNCFVCPLSVLVGERLVCEITRDEVLRWKIDFNCPLIELPPHGRLIDADALKMDAGEVCEDYGDYAEFGFSREQIDNAPTIIEAEDG